MFDDKMHVFKAGWTETRTSPFLQALMEQYKGVEGIDRHEVVIVGKGKDVDAETPEPIFVGKDLSIFEGSGETRLSDSLFDSLPGKADITYIGLTSKSHEEITAIARKWETEHRPFNEFNHCQSFVSHLLSEIKDEEIK
ncbi:hypothetical protein MMC32_008048 [Xylographa parallela]|nr:hypothetical protein [Xylographa parallela]